MTNLTTQILGQFNVLKEGFSYEEQQKSILELIKALSADYHGRDEDGYDDEDDDYDDGL